MKFKEILVSILAIIVFLTFMFGIGWAAQGNEFFMYKFFAPRQEQVRREVFEQSKAYNEGMAQELEQMQLDYVKATPDQKKALASVILHRVASYDVNKLTPELQLFISEIRKESLQ